MALVALANGPLPRTEELFGIYGSERKARNALLRVAASHRLCHALLGLSEAANASCLACPRGAVGASCDGNVDRLRHLEHAFTALRPLRLPAWPYGGPVGIRERSDLHVVDNWRYLGTARSEDELAAVLEARPRAFDATIFRVLAKMLPRLPQRRIVCLSKAPDRGELECGAS
jgi:DNA polymerase-3 subunit epsilon